MNGEELQARVQQKLGDSVEQHERIARLEVYAENIVSSLERLPCGIHSEKIDALAANLNTILGGLKVIGVLIGAGLLSYLFARFI